MGQHLEKIKATCLTCSNSLISQDVDLKTLQPINKEYSSPSADTDEIVVFESPFHKSSPVSVSLSFLNINNSKDSDASTTYTQDKANPYLQKLIENNNRSLGLKFYGSRQRKALKSSFHKARSSNFSGISINLVESVRVNME